MIEADYNGVRERDGERALNYHLVRDHKEAMFQKELEKFTRHTLGNKHPPQRRWASTQARNAHRRIH